MSLSKSYVTILASMAFSIDSIIRSADLIIESMEKAIDAKMVTYDFERLMENANLVSCSGFADEMIKRM